MPCSESAPLDFRNRTEAKVCLAYTSHNQATHCCPRYPPLEKPAFVAEPRQVYHRI